MSPPVGTNLLEIKDLVGIAGGLLARIRIIVVGKTPQAGSFANRWLSLTCTSNLKHRPCTVKSFLFYLRYELPANTVPKCYLNPNVADLLRGKTR
jgi:hypothetical protein